MDYIFSTFPITDSEYEKVEQLFGDLAHYATWQLIKKNVKNNHTDDHEDIVQEIRMASIHAVSYTKRQVYIESCLSAISANLHRGTEEDRRVLNELASKWMDRTKHGASRQKFGEPEEAILDELVIRCVPLEDRPDKKKPLDINKKFINYCKATMWNRQRCLGKKITREKTIRSGSVSLSEYDYLVSDDGMVSAIKISS